MRKPQIRKKKLSTGEPRRTLSPPKVPKSEWGHFTRSWEHFQANLVRATTVSSQLYGSISSYDLVGLIQDLDELSKAGISESQVASGVLHALRVLSVHLATIHVLILHAITPLLLVAMAGLIVWIFLRGSNESFWLRCAGDLVFAGFAMTVAGGTGAFGVAVFYLCPETVRAVFGFLKDLKDNETQSPDVHITIVGEAAYSFALLYEDVKLRREFCRPFWLMAGALVVVELLLCAWADRLTLFLTTLAGCVVQGLVTGLAAMAMASRGESLDKPPHSSGAEELLVLLARSPVVHSLSAAVIAGFYPSLEAKSGIAYFNLWAEHKLNNSQAALKEMEGARQILFGAWQLHAQQSLWGGGLVSDTVGGITSGVSSMASGVASGATKMIFGSSEEKRE